MAEKGITVTVRSGWGGDKTIWYIAGNTYPVKEILKAEKAQWNPKAKRWTIYANDLPASIRALAPDAPPSPDVPDVVMTPKPEALEARAAALFEKEPENDHGVGQTLVIRRPKRKKADIEQWYNITQTFVGYVSKSVGDCFVYGLALDEGKPVYLSLAGSAGSIESVWAKLTLGEQVSVIRLDTAPPDELLVEPDGEGTLTRFQKRLVTGLDHMILIADAMIDPKYADVGRTYLISVNDMQARSLLGDHIANLVKIAVFRDWHNYLWAQGISSGLLTLCVCYGGVTAYSIDLNQADWTTIICDGVKDGVLRLPESKGEAEPCPA